jgi:hypothetical protein
MNFFKKIFIVGLLAGLLFLSPTARAQTDDPNVFCEDPNDPDTCYSDPDAELKKILQKVDEEPLAVKRFKISAADLNPLNFTGPQDIFSAAINLLMAFIGSLALILYIYAGLLWMSAGGNSDKVSRAKTILVWTTLGVIVMGGSYMLVRVVLEYVG